MGVVPCRAICHNGCCADFAYLKSMIRYETSAGRPPRDLMRAMLRGFGERCPACGNGGLYRRYLKTRDDCTACGEPLHHHRTDDAPPYFTILVVGHLIVGGVLALEKWSAPPTWVHLAIWLPLTLIGSLWLLPRVKGALLGLQWALYMHGFDPAHSPAKETASLAEPQP